MNSKPLIPHKEVDVEPADISLAYKIIEPELVTFISHPYERSFSQLKDAALATIRMQKLALNRNILLKDASAYNIQFHKGKPVLINTLSFEKYKEGESLVAYRQSCQHFLAPLALMAKTDVRLRQLLHVYIDGVPLDLASRLLPPYTHLSFGLLARIHLNVRTQSRYPDRAVKRSQQNRSMSIQSLLGPVDSLVGTVKKLEWKPEGTEWGNYYDITNYSDAAFEHKKNLISEWPNRVSPRLVWELGVNTDIFIRLATERGNYSIAFDIDPAAGEQNYRQAKSSKEKNILPSVLDLTNPSPALGWHNRERELLSGRATADIIFALAVIDHLAISNNVPLQKVADFFNDMDRRLVIEFVPKSDSQVIKLLKSRVDILTAIHVRISNRFFRDISLFMKR